MASSFPEIEDQYRLLLVGFTDEGLVFAMNATLIAQLRESFNPEVYAQMVKDVEEATKLFISKLIGPVN